MTELVFNPQAFWTLAFQTPQGIFYLKARDYPLLCEVIWKSWQGQTPDVPILNPSEYASLQKSGLLDPDDQWQMPTEAYVVIYACLRERGLSGLGIKWEADHTDFFNQIFTAIRNPSRGLAIAQTLDPKGRELWQEIGMLCELRQLPDAVLMADFSLTELYALIPYRDRIQSTQAKPNVRIQQTPQALRLPAQDLQNWQKTYGPGSHLWLAQDPAYGIFNPIFAYPYLQNPFAPESKEAHMQATLLRAAYAEKAIDPTLIQELHQALKSQLVKDNYLILPRLFSPLFLATVRAYLRKLYQQGYFQLYAFENIQRDVIHNEPLMQFIHLELTRLLNQIAPEPVKNSYCFLARYKPGADLKKHTDRELCAWNLSLVLDLEPETSGRDVWPIYLEMPDQVKEIHLEIGDGVLYQGTEYPHWRNTLPEGHRATVCFFHFVPQDYVGLLY